MSQLARFQRVPRLYIKLPSGTHYYTPQQIQFALDGSIPIRAMTALDERMLKSPDALLNGDSIVGIIRSCVPEIADPHALLAPDVDAIVLAILQASLGAGLKFTVACPACAHVNEYELDMQYLLSTSKQMDYPAEVKINMGTIDNIPTELVVQVKPYTFATNTRHQLSKFKHSKLLQVARQDDMDDQTKLEIMNSCFQDMVNIKFENIQECIVGIAVHEMINGEVKITWERDAIAIREFLMSAERASIEPIINRIDDINETTVDKQLAVTCSACNHAWTTEVEFNPANFFDQNSRPSTLMP